MNKLSTIMVQKRTFITIVNQAEVAYRQFLGMNRTRLEPGIRLKLPFVHQLDRVDMRERRIMITNLNAFTADNVPVSIAGSLFFKVEDAEKACFSVSNYVAAVGNVGESSARAVIGRFPYDKIISQRGDINTELIKTVDSSLDVWGISCNRFEITDFGPQNKDVAKHLEKQMEAERSRRENELNTQAKIRTAEGERDAIKLKADANFYQVKQEADSNAYALEQESMALAKQLEIIKKSSGSVTEAQIMDFLLEMERQKNLHAIAANNKNVVYFVDPRNMFPLQRHINITDKVE
jgi:regulator of protease activity HflC (stomatin/prohibitin superfamily)